MSRVPGQRDNTEGDKGHANFPSESMSARLCRDGTKHFHSFPRGEGIVEVSRERVPQARRWTAAMGGSEMDGSESVNQVQRSASETSHILRWRKQLHLVASKREFAVAVA